MNLPLFIETLRLTDGQLFNLHHHNQRLNQTRRIYFEDIQEWDLAKMINVPSNFQKGFFKCRVTYGQQVEQIEIEPYLPRFIQRLRLINDDTIEYSFKHQNRVHLNTLFAKRGEADDVLITKNGFVTDTTYANIVFWDGQAWFTPDTFLLAGTQRARLLEEGVIFEQKIRAQDLPKYSHARLINSMLDFEKTPNILTENIR
jgi:4-amino-4-deoxychorismate lyase